MNKRTVSRGSLEIEPAWFERLKRIAQELDLGYDPVSVRGAMSGDRLIASVRSLGGEIRIVDPSFTWVIRTGHGDRRRVRSWIPDLQEGETELGDFHGVLLIKLRGQSYLALRADTALNPHLILEATVLAGPSLAATLRLAEELRRTFEGLARRRLKVFGTGLMPSREEPVDEDEILLPTRFKRELLDYVDAFWRCVEVSREWHIEPSRGLLFVGPPGTGKTLTIRHLLHRHPDAQGYLYINEDPGSRCAAFRGLVEEVASSRQPAIVVLEDIDRLLGTGAITAELFLNVLDGLLRPEVPVLWVATSNDASELRDNLLDRPGRFDRVFTFPRPGSPERLALLKHFSPWPVPREVLEEVVSSSQGLTGAHLKEVCAGAAFSATEAPSAFPAALLRELERVKRHHREAIRREGPRSTSSVGFAREGNSVERVVAYDDL